MQHKVRRIHMIGIGGSGMSGIAEVLLNLGYEVSGSDMASGAPVKRLRDLGAEIYIGHGRKNVGNADVVVKSTAINADNPELVEALSRRIPVIPRAEMLAELMRLRTGIAVAGTHGKTTTTSLLATIFTEAKKDPTVIIGGRLNTYGSGARLGEGEYLIAEADESDGSFLCLLPIMTIVTNVDADHLDYYTNQDDIDSAFTTFMNSLPFYGLNVVCSDDPGVARLLPHVKRPTITYGLGETARIRGIITSGGPVNRFTVLVDGVHFADIVLPHPGQHNILNALGAIGVALEAGIKKEDIVTALSKFGGVGRRFEIKGERNGITVIDDYGHHPAEIAATISTAKACYPGRRIVVAFQPHRFTRTQALFGQFCKSFDEVDELLLTEIYPASETPIPGVSGESLAQGIRQVGNARVHFYPDFTAMEEALPDMLQSNDVFITLGAGSIWRVGQGFLEG
ncbi:UDP-N-acetylmuramate--L-alanine ligase [Desulfovibrio inopinatus]|uniref:UDP-N-acetylmuramate--L-alanine ligase n=1 Tax=Desulfovibrio inopinatus TaxID=102109 RepID=UPI0004295683|nr:UDP-N-acetylmuramate--L-alanine ligase [Desulfovibrio inopinatus]